MQIGSACGNFHDMSIISSYIFKQTHIYMYYVYIYIFIYLCIYLLIDMSARPNLVESVGVYTHEHLDILTYVYIHIHTYKGESINVVIGPYTISSIACVHVLIQLINFAQLCEL